MSILTKKREVGDPLPGEEYEKLKGIVDFSRKKGKSNKEIRSVLKRFGVSEDKINELTSPVEPEKTDSEEGKSPETSVSGEENMDDWDEDSPESEPLPAEKPGEKEDDGEPEKKGFNREEDVFSEEDFKKIEKKEDKSFLKKIFGESKDEDESKDEKQDTESFDLLSQKEISRSISKLQKQVEEDSMATSKQAGKLEILTQKNEETAEKIQNLVEKIGELRSTVLTRERVFNKMEDEFNNVKFVVNSFNPNNLEKRFENISTEMMKKEAAIGKIENKTGLIESKLNEYLSAISKIKSFDNVVAELEKIKEAEGRIKKMKLEIDKSASKVEIISQNIRESLKKINDASTKANNNQDAIKEIIASITKMESKMDFFTKKEDFEYIKEDVETIKKALFEKNFKKK